MKRRGGIDDDQAMRQQPTRVWPRAAVQGSLTDPKRLYLELCVWDGAAAPERQSHLAHRYYFEVTN